MPSANNAEDELREEKRMLELLNQTGTHLSRELNLDRLVQTATDAGVQLVGAAFGAFFYKTTDKSGQHLLLYTLSGAPPEAFAKFPLPGKTALFGPTLDGAAIVRSDDIREDPRYGRSEPHRGMPPGHLPVRSYLAVPVVSSSGEVHGGLFFGHPEPAMFSELAERAIVGIAAQAAIAIDNARLLEAMKASERRFRALIEHSADGIAVVDSAGVITYFSPSACAMEGYTAQEMLGTPCVSTTPPDDVPLLESSIAQAVQAPGNAIAMTFRRRHKSGSWLWLEGTLTNLLGDPAIGGIVANYRDVTSRKRAQEALIRSQKMEALGTLAGGIAHDFNNILLAISGNARLATEDLAEDHPVQQSLTEISKASQRATELVGRILAFSRKQEPKREVMALGPVVQEALTLLRSTLPAMIELSIRFDTKVPLISADSTQIHQVVMNLVTNAAHATRGGRGVIEVVLDEVTVPADFVAGGRELREGRCARISVSDDGGGMDKATLERIFDPFFTTKPVGQGTGLGLSVVDGIVTNHAGAIAVSSLPDRGTTFHVYFPAVSGAVASERPEPLVAQGAGKRVLYIDDDEALVLLMTRVLKRLGYRITGCASPQRGLKMFQDNPNDFDVVVTDLAMPGMSGFELTSELRKLRSGIPIVMSSGYFRPEDREAAHQQGVRDVLLKPYTVTELAAVLAQLFR